MLKVRRKRSIPAESNRSPTARKVFFYSTSKISHPTTCCSSIMKPHLCGGLSMLNANFLLIRSPAPLRNLPIDLCSK